MLSFPSGLVAHRRPTSLATAAIAATLLLAACGGSNAPSTAADPAAACAASADLTSSVATLDAIDLATVGSDDLKPSIDAVAAATAQVIETAPGDLAQEAEDLEGAVNVLEAAYEEASAGSIADSAAAIDTAIVGIKAQAAAMELALKPTCP
jgi:hypothetical protein